MELGIIETEEIAIGKARNMISYLTKIQKEIPKEENDYQEIRKIILKLQHEFERNEIVYIKRNANGDLRLNLLELDLL